MAARRDPVTQTVQSGGLTSPRALTLHMAKVFITAEDAWARGSDGDLHFADTYSRAS